jgi:hypothetical protein
VNVVCRRMSFAFVDFGDGVRKSPGSVYRGHNVPTTRILFLSLSLSLSLGSTERRPISAWELNFSGSFISDTYSKAKPRITIAPGHAWPQPRCFFPDPLPHARTYTRNPRCHHLELTLRPSSADIATRAAVCARSFIYLEGGRIAAGSAVFRFHYLASVASCPG